jgi:hypothetical protein
MRPKQVYEGLTHDDNNDDDADDDGDGSDDSTSWQKYHEHH